MAESHRVKVIKPPAFSIAAILSGLTELRHYTSLLIALSVHRIRVRYKQSVLGLAWAIVQPLALMFIYTIIFSVFTRVPTHGLPYPIFVFSALLPWTFFSTSLTNTATSLITHSQLITKVYFPREILPITYIVAALFDFLAAALVLLSMMIYYGVPLTLNALYAIPIMAALVAFALALGLFLSAVQVRFRDVSIALPLFLQLWMFASPVVYPLRAVPERYRFLYDLNPLVGFIESFRTAVLEGRPPDHRLLIQPVLIISALLPLSYLYFKRREATMADII